MAIKLMHIVQKRWHRLRGYELLADVIDGVQFKDGARVEQEAA
jgi:putative transposase